MEKINLLYIITKLELGGAQKQLLSLIGGLDKEKYNIFLFTARDGILIDQALSINGLKLYKSKFLDRSLNPIKDSLAAVEIHSFIKKNRIRIVHTHSSKAGILGRFAAKTAGVPIIIHTVHGWSFHDHQPGITNYFYSILEKICARFCDKIIVVSAFDKGKGLKKSIGREGQYTIIRYGIDYDELRADHSGSGKVLGFEDSGVVVGMVACFKPQKSPLDFIKLAAQLSGRFPDIKFVMIGDGFLRGKIHRLIKKLKLEKKIILSGWRNDIPVILSSLDVFVLTSLWEGLPIAVLEAQAAGVPVIATNTGGIQEVIRNGETGYLVKAGDITQMRDKVEELLINSSRRQDFITASRNFIASGEFFLSKMIGDTEKLYSVLLKKGQRC